MSNQVQSYKVPENFVIQELADYLQSRFTSQGYMVQVSNVGTAVQITVSKNIGGIHYVTGLGEQLTISLSVKNGQLNSFTGNQMWTDKIVTFIVGWFCLQFLWIFAAIGAYRQIQLPNDVHAAIFTYVSGL